MATFDPYSQPMGQTMAAPKDEGTYIPGLDAPASPNPIMAGMQQRKLQYENEGMQQQENQAKLAQQQDRIAAAAAAAQLATDPTTHGKAFHELSPEWQQHLYSLAPSITQEIPGLVNTAQTAATGRPVGAKLLADETASAEVNGTKVTGIMAQPETQVDPNTGQTINAPSNVDSMSKMVADLDLPMSVLGRLPPQVKMRVLTGAAKIAQSRGQEFNAQNYEAQQKARESFQPGGKNGQAILFNNTVLDHLAGVHDLVDSLNNNQRFSVLNAPLNAIASGIGGNTAIGRFQTAANTAATEYAKALAGGNQPAEPEIKHFQELLNPNLGPEQLKQNIQQMAVLLGGKVHELQNEWDATVKKPRDVPFLNDGAIKNLYKIGVNPALISPVDAARVNGTQQATPITPTSPTQSAQVPQAAAPSKPQYVRQKGIIYTLQPDGSYK